MVMAVAVAAAAAAAGDQYEHFACPSMSGIRGIKKYGTAHTGACEGRICSMELVWSHVIKWQRRRFTVFVGHVCVQNAAPLYAEERTLQSTPATWAEDCRERRTRPNSGFVRILLLLISAAIECFCFGCRGRTRFGLVILVRTLLLVLSAENESFCIGRISSLNESLVSCCSMWTEISRSLIFEWIDCKVQFPSHFSVVMPCCSLISPTVT
jgi:hypothetical protein